MNDKYYHPQIEEFHIGFEFERKAYAKDDWKPATMKNFEAPMESLYFAVEFQWVRVKFLDQQDIEECGFNWITTERGARPFGTYYAKDLVMLVHNHLKDCFIVYKTSFEVTEPTHVIKQISGLGRIIFEGKIKNKSELQRILKMIEI